MGFPLDLQRVWRKSEECAARIGGVRRAQIRLPRWARAFGDLPGVRQACRSARGGSARSDACRERATFSVKQREFAVDVNDSRIGVKIRG